MNTTQPSEFDRLGLRDFKQATSREWHGPCPFCGGKDRFVIFTDRPWPSWNWFCRHCGKSGWADQLNPSLRKDVDPVEQEYRRKLEQERIEAEAAQERLALAKFSDRAIFAEYHRRMARGQRDWWKNRGIEDDWQDLLQLGYTPDKLIRTSSGEEWHTPAYTIPYLRKDGTACTLQYRLENPPNPKDKYRFQYGLPVSWYNAQPYEPLFDQVLVCEGAIKAIVTRSRVIPTEVSVLALPSKSTARGEVAEQLCQTLADVGRVYVILDPDGLAEATSFVKQIGKRARLLELPAKIDDLIMEDSLSEYDLAGLFRTARAVS